MAAGCLRGSSAVYARTLARYSNPESDFTVVFDTKNVLAGKHLTESEKSEGFDPEIGQFRRCPATGRPTPSVSMWQSINRLLSLLLLSVGCYGKTPGPNLCENFSES